MTNVGPPPRLITRPQDLQRLADRLAHEAIVAVDTESNSLYAYQEQVCLVQFSTEQEDYLIDPFALVDLSALEPVFADPKIEKVFHAAEYDLICLHRDFGFTFTNLFDTMVAGSILGLEAVGLAAMLKNEFGIELDKRFQRANWGQRPLSAEMLAYARLDTRYLIALRNSLKKQLEEVGRWPLAAEDFNRLPQASGLGAEGEANGAGTGNHREPFWRVKGAVDLSPQQAAVLQELYEYRDGVARNLDRPLFKVLGDETLVAVAANTPSTLDELKELPGMTRGQMHRHGWKLLQAVQRGLKKPPVLYPRTPRPDERFVQRLENLRQWRKKTAQKLGVKSDVVLPRDLLYSLAGKGPATREALEDVLGDVPWRLEQFGDEILGVILEKKG